MARFHEAQRLRRALEDRKVIERAKGRLMDRDGIGEAEAYRRLWTTAMNTRRPMVEIAHEVLGAGDARAAVGPAPAVTEPARSVERYGPGRSPATAWSPRGGGRFTDAAAP